VAAAAPGAALAKVHHGVWRVPTAIAVVEYSERHGVGFRHAALRSLTPSPEVFTGTVLLFSMFSLWTD